jgi:hypothetical protein
VLNKDAKRSGVDMQYRGYYDGHPWCTKRVSSFGNPRAKEEKLQRPNIKTTSEDQWSDLAAEDGEEYPSHPQYSATRCNNTSLTCFAKMEKDRHSHIAPPIDVEATFRILDNEEDNNHADCDASIEGGRQNVVVTHPPSEVVPPYEVVEDEAHNSPRRIVDSCGRGHSTNTGEANWNIDVSPERQREATRKDVEWYGSKNADCEEP